MSWTGWVRRSGPCDGQGGTSLACSRREIHSDQNVWMGCEVRVELRTDGFNQSLSGHGEKRSWNTTKKIQAEKWPSITRQQTRYWGQTAWKLGRRMCRNLGDRGGWLGIGGCQWHGWKWRDQMSIGDEPTKARGVSSWRTKGQGGCGSSVWAHKTWEKKFLEEKRLFVFAP